MHFFVAVLDASSFLRIDLVATISVPSALILSFCLLLTVTVLRVFLLVSIASGTGKRHQAGRCHGR